MNKSLLAALTTTLLLATAPVTAPVQATSAIQRCQSSDGTLVYTDKACAGFGAKALPISGELLTRIAHEDALAAVPAPEAGGPADSLPNDPRIGPTRRSSAGGCARTPTQLAMDVQNSLTLGDVNRVAESYDWVGMSSKQGERTLDRLQGLIGRPVVDSHYFDAQVSLGGMPDAGASVMASSATSAGGNAGVLQLVLGDGAASSATNFDVHKYAGCYFIKF